MNHFFYSLITFFIALFFILLGFIGILLPWFPSMQQLVLTFLFEYSKITFLFGLSFLAIGIAFALNVLLQGRRDYYQFKVKGNEVSVDTELLQNYLHKYLRELFPENDLPCQLQLKKNKIHVTIDFPYMEQAEQQNLLEQLRKELKELFISLIDYEHDFFLSASFQPPSK
ncbi:MAG: hypothetical protein H0T62_11415 [Parachlamydiaceae bacterium]|nr:hypothetical protein [Parachlamydiaceae bacterium]